MRGAALRRALHAATGAVVLLAGPLGSGFPVVLAAGLAAWGLFEFLRLRVGWFRDFLARAVPVYRRHELERPSGAFYLVFGYALAAWFPPPASLGGILVGAVADPLGSLVGSTAGPGGGKTWRGSAAVLVTAFLVLISIKIPPLTAALAALIAALVERRPAGLDDNLVLAPATALALFLMA